MSNFKRMNDFHWKKNWAGNFGFIVPSLMSFQYTHMLKDVFGIGLNNIVITNKKGYTVCYFEKNELENFGKVLKKKVYDGEFHIEEWANALKDKTDLFYNAIDIKEDIITYSIFRNFRDNLNDYASAHRFVKVVVDYLDYDDLKQYLEILQEARLYAESVYDDAKKFSDRLAKSISKETGYSFSATRALTEKEIIHYFKTLELPIQRELEERYESCVLTYFGDSEEIKNGDFHQYENILLRLNENGGNFSGSSAYPGIVIGRARIISNPSDYEIFNEGEILVTGMTRPDFLSLMKKASAIITDAGGILSHAAITARELKIPCVIGTQKATKILQDGDLVEVDADKGTIKIIEYANHNKETDE